MEIYILLGFVLLFINFLGLELISRSKHSSYTTYVRCKCYFRYSTCRSFNVKCEGQIQNVLAFFAILFASINVLAYLVTNRMLSMFKRNLNEYVDRHNHFQNLVYIVSSVLFILGIKMLGKESTAVRGNILSSVAMLSAVSVTLIDVDIGITIIISAIILGALIGSVLH